MFSEMAKTVTKEDVLFGGEFFTLCLRSFQIGVSGSPKESFDDRD